MHLVVDLVWQLLPRCEQPNARHPPNRNPAHNHPLHWLHHKVQVHHSRPSRRGSVVVNTHGRWYANDTLRVLCHPVTDLSQSLHLRFIEAAVTLWSNVEQKVATSTCHFDQRGNQRSCALTLRSTRMPRPHLPDRQTEFPWASGCHNGEALLWRFIVALPRETVVDNNRRLQRFDERAQSRTVPLRRRPLPLPVKPKQINGAVVREYLGELTAKVALETEPRLGG